MSGKSDILRLTTRGLWRWCCSRRRSVPISYRRRARRFENGHLELWNSSVHDLDRMSKTQTIRVDASLKSGLLHQAAQAVISEHQRIQFLDHCGGFLAAERMTNQALMRIRLVNR
jgi:hypothetical protein